MGGVVARKSCDVAAWMTARPAQIQVVNLCAIRTGTGERPVAPVYEDGEKTVTLKGERIAEEFQDLLERYVDRTYPRRPPQGAPP